MAAAEGLSAGTRLGSCFSAGGSGGSQVLSGFSIWIDLLVLETGACPSRPLVPSLLPGAPHLPTQARSSAQSPASGAGGHWGRPLPPRMALCAGPRPSPSRLPGARLLLLFP